MFIFVLIAKYLLLERKGTVSIVMHKDSIATDVLQAFLHALVMANLFDEHQSAHSESHSWMDKHYQNLVVKVKVLSRCPFNFHIHDSPADK